jgi:hypothetical protein
MCFTMTIEVPVDFQPLGRCGRRGVAPPEQKPSLPPGRVPRVARLMALALRLDELVRTGPVRRRRTGDLCNRRRRLQWRAAGQSLRASTNCRHRYSIMILVPLLSLALKQQRGLLFACPRPAL